MLKKLERGCCSSPEQLPGVKVIAENLPWHEFLPQLRMAAEPDLISEVIEDCDLGLLLDLSHAQISAQAFGMDFEEYINRLPLNRAGRIAHYRYSGVCQFHHRSFSTATTGLDDG
jgi:uncharacterized protein (UPF0276 family)